MKLIYRIVNNLQYFAKVHIRFVILAVSSFLILGSNIQLMAAESDLNQTQKNMNLIINSGTCGSNGTESRNGIGDQYDAICLPLRSENPDDAQTEAIQVGSPEQTGSSGTNANKTSANQTSSANKTVMNRMVSLRSESEGVNSSSVQINNNGKPLDLNSNSEFNSNNGSLAIANDYSKLGLWVNGVFRFGDVESSAQQTQGYDFNNLGVTLGLDYAMTEDFILGASFTYLNTSGDYTSINTIGGVTTQRAGGDFNTDLFNGSIYASYSINDDFYIDGLAFYGGNNYNIIRNVNYKINGVDVNEKLQGTPDGKQYGFNISTGYNFRFQRLTVEPYLSVGYIGTDIDAYDETALSATGGWAQRYEAQKLESVKTTLGALFAYSFDVPWGVLVPQLRGEWHHEFEDDGRNITSSFLGNTSEGIQSFSTVIDNPDRDYFTFGTSITSAFNYGITAFLAYDMLIGYNNVNSYGFTLGGRVDF